MGTEPIKSPVPNLISRYNIKCSFIFPSLRLRGGVRGGVG